LQFITWNSYDDKKGKERVGMEKKDSSRSSFFYWIIGLFGLNFVVLVHEVGHYLACKLFGVGTPVFSIGFGPVLASFKMYTTTFQLALLPLGGFVSIDPAGFEEQAYAVKLFIMLAGIFTNIIFAFVVFFFLSMQAKKRATTIIARIEPGSPAHASGLKVGDKIHACGDEQVADNPQVVIKKTVAAPGKTMVYIIEREQTMYNIPVMLGDEHPILGPGVGWLGVEFAMVEDDQPLLLERIKNGFLTMGATVRGLSGALGLMMRKEGYGGIIGPFGIMAITGKSLQYGTEFFFLILALLSINIALFNLLPIPLFDGGKAFMLTIEAVVGPVPDQVMNGIYMIFIILLMLFFMLISIKDVRRSLRRRGR
jgi:regulator of sigma E protease